MAVFRTQIMLNPIALVLSGYIVGIIGFDTLFSEIDLFFPLFSISLLLLAFLIWGIRTNTIFKKLFTVNTFLFWMLVGGVQTYYNQSSGHSDYFELYANTESTFLVRLQEVSVTSSGKFYKSIGEVKAVLNGHDTLKTSGNVLFYFEKSNQPVRRNTWVLIRTPLRSVENNGNIGEFDSQRYWKYKQIQQMAFVYDDDYVSVASAGFSFNDFFLDCRDFLSGYIDQYMSGQEAAVAKGLVLGDRSSIENETTQTFSHTGAMHILAVSGMHVAILVLIINWILQQFPRFISKRNAVIISLVLIWFYCLMTGFSPSVSRAAWMFTFLTGGTLLHRDYNAVNGLMFSALIILLWNPYSLFDIGFQLSYCAMIGIFTFFPYLHRQLIFKNKWIQTVWEGTALGIAAQVFTTPFALYYFHQFPNYFWVTNIALSFYGTLILAGGLLLFLTGYFSLIGKMIGFLLSWSIFSMLWIMRGIENLPDSVSEGFTLHIAMVILLYVCIVVLFISLIRQQLKIVIATLSLCLCLVGWLVFQRFNNMTNSRFVIFNDRDVVLCLKQRDKTVFIYDKQKMKASKAKMLIAGFQKIYPSKSIDTVFVSPEKSIQLQTKKTKLSVTPQTGGYQIQIAGEQFYLATSQFQATPSAKTKTILSPFITDETAFYQLKDGAFNYVLEE